MAKKDSKSDPQKTQSPKLTSGQRKALEFLSKVDSAELSNKTGYGQYGNYIHRNSGHALVRFGFANYGDFLARHEVSITPAGRAALSPAPAPAANETITTDESETMVKCRFCGGIGSVNCGQCVNGYYSDATGYTVLCNRCNGTAVVQCADCKGTGKQPAPASPVAPNVDPAPMTETDIKVEWYIPNELCSVNCGYASVTIDFKRHSETGEWPNLAVDDHYRSGGLQRAREFAMVFAEVIRMIEARIAALESSKGGQ